jgi:ABC-type phosphate/phosphonate transport system substrate-binding protein
MTLSRLGFTALLIGWCIVLACGELISASLESSVLQSLQDDPVSSRGDTTQLYDGYGGACQVIKQFDPSRHKETYKVGVLAIRGFDDAYAEFNATFSDYLTATAGQRFDPPIRFEMVALDFETLFIDTSAGMVDFIYVNPSAFSCIESEFEAYSLASQVSLRKVNGVKYHLKKFGGVIAALADNDRVNTIRDIEGTIVAAASISGLGSGQLQFLEMHKAGMNYLNDPKQLVFTSNQGKVVLGLLSGEFDVGFIRTDQIETTVDADGNPVDLSLFKVIDPLPKLEIDGIPFPFPSSTVSCCMLPNPRQSQITLLYLTIRLFPAWYSRCIPSGTLQL